MSDVVIVTSEDRNDLLAAALLRGHLGRGRVEVQRVDALPRALAHQANLPNPDELYVVGLGVRSKGDARIAEALTRLGKRGRPVCWLSHAEMGVETLRALRKHGRKESSLEPDKDETASIIQGRFKLTGEHAARLVAAAQDRTAAEADALMRPWLFILDLVAANRERHPGYLQSLIVRLSGGVPDEQNAIDRLLHNQRETEVRRSQERARGFVVRSVHAAGREIVVVDLRGERALDWRVVASALGGTVTADEGGEMLVLLAPDGSVKVQAAYGEDAAALVELAAELVPDFPSFVASRGARMATTRPGVAGFVRHEDRSEVETILGGLSAAVEKGPKSAETKKTTKKSKAAPAETAEPEVAPAMAGPESDLARELAAARGQVDVTRVSPFEAVAEFAPLPEDLEDQGQLMRVEHADGEPDGLALVVDDSDPGGGVMEEALQSLVETAAEHDLGHLYVKAAGRRYGAAEFLDDGISLVDPADPADLPFAWDVGHYRPLALPEAWLDDAAFVDAVRLVRVDPSVELSMHHTAVRLSYRGVRVIELRRRGRSILGPDREGVDFAPRRFRKLGPSELSQVTRIKRAIDQDLDDRGAKRATVNEIASKVLTDTRTSSDAGYWMVARDVTFPQARHLRLHLLAVNRSTRGLVGMHIAVPGTMSFPRWPLRSLRLAHWLDDDARRAAIAADASQILSQKAQIGLPDYLPVEVDARIPMETVLLVPRGERAASDEFEGRFDSVVARLDPKGGFHVVELPDWTARPAVVPYVSGSSARRRARSAA